MLLRLIKQLKGTRGELSSAGRTMGRTVIHQALVVLALRVLVSADAIARSTQDENGFDKRSAVTQDGQTRQQASDQQPAAAGAQTQSADRTAKELAIPNTPLATLHFEYELRVYAGRLPHAGGQVLTPLFKRSLNSFAAGG